MTTAWDVLNNVIAGFPPVAFTLLLAAALATVVIFIAGFARHGVNFLKYGFKQMVLDATFEKRFDGLDARIDGLHHEIDGLDEKMSSRIDGLHHEIDGLDEKMTGRIDGLGARLDRIEVNHFGHLKNYLGVLNGILLDKGVIDNESRARLDNELRGM
jgi:hypothetical protein